MTEKLDAPITRGLGDAATVADLKDLMHVIMGVGIIDLDALEASPFAKVAILRLRKTIDDAENLHTKKE